MNNKKNINYIFLGPYPEQNFGFPIEYFRRCDNSKMKNIMGCNQSMFNDDAIKVSKECRLNISIQQNISKFGAL